MPDKLPLHLHALTHTGLVRTRNEDAHGLFPDTALAVLADGLGGNRAGEVASALAVSVMGKAFGQGLRPLRPEAGLGERERALREAVSHANAAIQAQSETDPECEGMATTVVAAHWTGTQLLVGHVGDSRAYLARSRDVRLPQMTCHTLELQRLTRDHSTAPAAAGKRMAADGGPSVGVTMPHQTLLTRALGVESEVVLELHRHNMQVGDLVLLCSDGLTDMVSEARIESLLRSAFDAQPPTAAGLDRAAQSLVTAALDAGGVDNITVVLGLLGPQVPAS